MRYSVELTENAFNFLKKLDKNQRVRIRNKIKKLENNPQLGKPLTASLAGTWSLRIGKYRAIYEIVNKKLIIFVLRIGARKNIY